jgi:hypothetical protein
MNLSEISNRVIVGLLTFALCGAPQLAQAWQQPSAPPSGGETQAVPAPTPAPTTPAPATGTEPQTATPPPTQGAQPDQSAPQQGTSPAQTAPAQQGSTPSQTGTTVDPAQGPLEPVPSETAPEGLPSAETTGETSQQSAQDETVTDQLPEKPQPQKPSEPVGAAGAEKGRTAGGAASKPAGAAIAPAKQRQVRSFLIKLGAIAGVGIAAGTIYLLTRGTPGAPPNSVR